MALTLQQVADRLQLSYSTVFAMRHRVGFRLPGSRVWRVLPSRLAELCETKNNVTRLSMRVAGENQCPSAKIKIPGSGTSTSARQAAKELDALLKPRTERRLRSTTTA
ncbi:hypothetical protein BOC51_11700 [Burkholderia pseudomallei]|nr:hypothetical protein BOC51_11700 [Burkholderia pseudomallei]